ncbi:LysR family transcriptional regulator [Pseudomonas fluorescens]|uniref:LysR family transcriptional regulator n=1 Tax=Pseudomonas fluorescens TaxID=294 RepID=UPI001BEA8E8C|nr:LysR family transcriptional regulator [Pseudomonas fluorescens]MBT2372471.1 LysR family transcriptional regulator [Pseudomonas fluorescens]
MAMFQTPGVEGLAGRISPASHQRSWTTLVATVEPRVAEYFLVSARCGCFKQAARHLNIRAPLLRRQLAQLEDAVGHTLFSYQGSTLTLSREGLQLQAQLMVLVPQRIAQVVSQPLVRLAVAAPILHDILSRDLIALLRRDASVRLEVIAVDSNQQSLQTVNADVVVWLSDPGATSTSPGFAIREPQHLASLDYLPHMAKRYSRATARPEHLEGLADYLLVQWQPERQVKAFAPWNAQIDLRGAGVVQVHTYELMLEMIRCSACIGLLPAYMSRFDRSLMPLPGLFDTPMQRQVWMALNAQLEASAAVQAIVDLIVRTFDERREWFE